MGEALVKARAQRYRQEQDEAFREEFRQEGLLSKRPEIYGTDYDCSFSNGITVPIATGVFLQRPSDNTLAPGISGDYVEVIAGNCISGFVTGAEATSLLEIMASEPRCQGILAATVVAESPWDGHYSVRVLKEDQSNGNA